MFKPNDTQIKIIKAMLDSGDIPKESKIVIKEHEVYCHLPDNDRRKTIVAIHSNGTITEHITKP